MEKKVFLVLLVIVILMIFILTLILVFSKPKGNIENVKISISDSKTYLKKEIESAINIVLEKFKGFPATLDEIWYDEEKSHMDNTTFAKQYNTDEAIVLYSNFTAYSTNKMMSSPLNSGAKYENWNWILVRNNKDIWELKTFGY